MKTPSEYLDDLKEKTGSDYASAKALNIDRSAVSNIRNRGKMGDETAVKLAKLLEIDEGEILISVAAARSDGEIKQKWEEIWAKIAKQSAHTAILILLLGGNSALPFYAVNTAPDSEFVYYVKLSVRRFLSAIRQRRPCILSPF